MASAHNGVMPGAAVIWLHALGGYAFTARVLARVVRVSPRRIRIRVFNDRARTWVERSVKLENLAPMTDADLEQLADIEQASLAHDGGEGSGA